MLLVTIALVQVCLLTGDAYEFHGDNGENLVKVDVPDDLK